MFMKSLTRSVPALLVATIGLIAVAGPSVADHEPREPMLGPVIRPLVSLKGWVPPQPELTGIVRNKDALVILGKAMFWDMQAGSDGMACASCHVYGGADSRVSNVLSPGLRSVPTDKDYNAMASGRSGDSDMTLVMKDFPFFQPNGQGMGVSNLAGEIVPVGTHDPNFHPIDDKKTEVLFSTNDVVSSPGTFSGEFIKTSRRKQDDTCGPPEAVNDYDHFAQAGWHGSGLGARKVEPRNTPSIINAGFNHRNFHDGRGNNIFNGVDTQGARNTKARVVVALNRRTATLESLSLSDSSLASQAVGPILSDFEMACSGKTFADVGRKALQSRPLALQKVHRDDPVLGRLATNSKGLRTTYKKLIQNAFEPKYWSLRGKWGIDQGEEGADWTIAKKRRGYTQMELNYAMFWGIAIQAYEMTQVSDQSPFDAFHGCVDTFTQDGIDHCPEGGTAAYAGLEGINPELALLGSKIFANIFAIGDHNNPGVNGDFKTHDLPAGLCAACHSGPFMSGAAFAGGNGTLSPADFRNLRESNPLSIASLLQLNPGGQVERMPMGDMRASQLAGLDAFLVRAFPVHHADLNDNILRAFEIVEGLEKGTFSPALYDIGFYNIGVTPTVEDFGLGESFSFASQIANGPITDIDDRAWGYLKDNTAPNGKPIDQCSFVTMFDNLQRATPGPLPTPDKGFIASLSDVDTVPMAFGFDAGTTIKTAVTELLMFEVCDPDAPLPDAINGHRLAVDGATKVPSLRNVALTAPYFHNGGYQGIDEVIAFYNRGGNFLRGLSPDKSGDGHSLEPFLPASGPIPNANDSTATLQHGTKYSNLDPEIVVLGLDLNPDVQGAAALREYLKTFTDNRVACEMGIFSHPELRISGGHAGLGPTDKNGDGRADDMVITFPATGADGLPGIGKACYPNDGTLFDSVAGNPVWLSSQ